MPHAIFFCHFRPISISPGAEGQSLSGSLLQRFEKPRSSFHLMCISYCGCINLFCNVWVSVRGGCFDNCVGVLVIRVLVCTVFCIVCTVFYIVSFMYIYSYLFYLY